jgi:hypothetical protein
MLLKPTKSEIEIAIQFVRKTSTPPKPKFYPNFEEMIENLRNVAT